MIKNELFKYQFQMFPPQRPISKRQPTKNFLSIYCNPNIKCNTLFDWLTEKIDKIPTKEHGHLRSSTRIQNWHLRIPLNSFLKLRTLRIKTSIFSWFLSHKCKQIQVHQSTYLVTSRTDNN